MNPPFSKKKFVRKNLIYKFRVARWVGKTCHLRSGDYVVHFQQDKRLCLLVRHLTRLFSKENREKFLLAKFGGLTEE